MSESLGYRGYIASRPIDGTRTAQHVQNLVVRDYAQRIGVKYLLSATEYAMPGSYLILEQVFDELPKLDGIILFSLFMLPHRAERRAALWRRLLAEGRSLHAALEGVAIVSEADVARVEDVWLVRDLLACSSDPRSLP